MNTRIFACALCALVFTSPLLARDAVVENVRYGAYLIDRPSTSSQNLATLRKGLVVELLDETSHDRWALVRVKDPADRLVVPMRSGWPGSEAATGWVSKSFVTALAEARPTVEPAHGGDENDPYDELRRQAPITSPRPRPRPVVTAPAAEENRYPRRAVLHRAEDPESFYGAYLQETASRSARSLAVLRKGLEVQALAEEGAYVKVRFSPAAAGSLFIAKVAEIGPSTGSVEGWVGRSYLRFLADGSTTGDDEDEGEDLYGDLAGGGTEGQVDGGTTPAGDGPTGGGSGSSWTTPADGRVDDEGVSPRFDGPKVYYLFGADGKDGEYFKGLARGSWGSKNVVMKNAKADAAAHGATIVPVVVESVAQIVQVMREGLIPPADGGKKDLYEVADLRASRCRIAGCQVVSHAGCDGPVIEHVQLNFRPFVEDRYATAEPERPTIYNRVVRGAHIRMSGCNTGNCQYWEEHSSFSHILAALWADKDVKTHGKRSTGDVNSDAFATFAIDGRGEAHRVTPEKKDYFFYVKKDRVYSEISLTPESDEERAAMLDWYRDRGIDVKASRDGGITVALPEVTRVSRDSEKDPVLLKVVQMLGEDRSTRSEFYRYLLYVNEIAESDEMEKARAALPQLRKLFDDLVLRRTIQKVKEENGGRLDENDFRIWFRIHYHDYDNEADRQSIGYRACVCDDAHLKKALSSDSLFNRFRRSDW